MPLVSPSGPCHVAWSAPAPPLGGNFAKSRETPFFSIISQNLENLEISRGGARSRQISTLAKNQDRVQTLHWKPPLIRTVAVATDRLQQDSASAVVLVQVLPPGNSALGQCGFRSAFPPSGKGADSALFSRKRAKVAELGPVVPRELTTGRGGGMVGNLFRYKKNLKTPKK